MYKVDIKEFRRKNKLTQKQLATYFGIGQGFISQMENAINPVPEKYIRKILDDPQMDSSMVQVVEPVNDVKMPREVFDKISQLIDTVCSQQGTIADQQKLITEQHRTIDRLTSPVESVGVRPAEDAGCADVG